MGDVDNAPEQPDIGFTQQLLNARGPGISLGDALSVALREGRQDGLDQWAASNRAEALRVVALTHRLTRLATAPPVVRPLRNLALRLLALVPAVRRGLAEQLSAIGPR